jgi:hypothetical protein
LQQDIGEYTIFEKQNINLTLTAAILLMLTMSSQQLSSSPVSAQAQTTTAPLSFRTTEPARGGGECAGTTDARLTFQGQGTIDSDNNKHGTITGGTFQITNSSSSDGQISTGFAMYTSG